jgi:hypothetical protein
MIETRHFRKSVVICVRMFFLGIPDIRNYTRMHVYKRIYTHVKYLYLGIYKLLRVFIQLIKHLYSYIIIKLYVYCL